jgi:hypothetical protein
MHGQEIAEVTLHHVLELLMQIPIDQETQEILQRTILLCSLLEPLSKANQKKTLLSKHFFHQCPPTSQYQKISPNIPHIPHIPTSPHPHNPTIPHASMSFLWDPVSRSNVWRPIAEAARGSVSVAALLAADGLSGRQLGRRDRIEPVKESKHVFIGRSFRFNIWPA